MKAMVLSLLFLFGSIEKGGTSSRKKFGKRVLSKSRSTTLFSDFLVEHDVDGLFQDVFEEQLSMDFEMSMPTKSKTKSPTPSSGRPPALQPTSAPTVAAMGGTPSPHKDSSSLPPDSTANPASSVSPGKSPTPNGSPGTFSPTEEPTSIMTPSGSCETKDGSFGSLVGTQIVVQFGYELETDPVSQGDLISDVLPPLEKAFNDFLLSALFPAECGSSRRLEMARRRLLIRGLSARPDDSLVDDVVCSQLKVQGNNCVVILGELTLFVDKERRLNDEQKVQDSLKQGMEDDAFLGSHRSIDRVTYVDLGGDPVNSDGDTNSITQSGNGLNGVLVGFVVAAAGTALIVATAIVYRRRKSSDDADQTTTMLSDVPLPAQSVEDTEQPSDGSAGAVQEAQGDVPITEQTSETSVYIESDSSEQQSTALGAFPTSSSSFLSASPSADTVRVDNIKS